MFIYTEWNGHTIECFLYPLAQRSWREYTGFTLSVRPCVRLCLCGQNRMRSVSSTILAVSISYLHTLLSSFRRCVAYKVFFSKFISFLNFGKFFKFVVLTLSCFDLGSNMNCSIIWAWVPYELLNNMSLGSSMNWSIVWVSWGAGRYRQVSNIRRTSVGNKIVDNSDVVGASPVGAAPTTSSLST